MERGLVRMTLNSCQGNKGFYTEYSSPIQHSVKNKVLQVKCTEVYPVKMQNDSN